MGHTSSRSPSEDNENTNKHSKDIENQPKVIEDGFSYKDNEDEPSVDIEDKPSEGNKDKPSEDNEDKPSADNKTASFLSSFLTWIRFEDKPKDYKYDGQMKVKEINKTALGRFIVKWVGNEGTEDTYESKGLRELLQHAISCLETRPKEVWVNAALEIYDKEGRVFSVCSGDARNKFLLSHDGRNEPKLTPVKNFY